VKLARAGGNQQDVVVKSVLTRMLISVSEGTFKKEDVSNHTSQSTNPIAADAFTPFASFTPCASIKQDSQKKKSGNFAARFRYV
jgi:hypothetical protein